MLGTRGRSRWAAATGFLTGAAPAEPLPRRPPQRGPGAAMPSDFISLLSADLDLESPKSLYSKGESAAGAALGLLGEQAGEPGRRSHRRPGRIAGGPSGWSLAAGQCLRAPRIRLGAGGASRGRRPRGRGERGPRGEGGIWLPRARLNWAAAEGGRAGLGFLRLQRRKVAAIPEEEPRGQLVN